MTPNFKRVLEGAASGLVLKPLLHSYLYEARFPDRFDVTFHKAGKPREPDGWFHPSTHPLMDARQLYYYLTAPAQWEAERLSYESRMAVTMGSAVHGFIEACIRHGGWMAPLEGECPACHRPHGVRKGQCDEYGAADPVLRRRGHMDGVLDIPGWGKGIFEFKTGGRADFATDLDLDWFKKRHLDYYAQVQEYMDLSGHRQAIVLFAQVGYPFVLNEFQVPYDAAFAARTREKYDLVRAFETAGQPPEACCPLRSSKSRSCPASACPVKVM
jgi:hypothetical protein